MKVSLRALLFLCALQATNAVFSDLFVSGSDNDNRCEDFARRSKKICNAFCFKYHCHEHLPFSRGSGFLDELLDGDGLLGNATLASAFGNPLKFFKCVGLYLLFFKKEEGLSPPCIPDDVQQFVDATFQEGLTQESGRTVVENDNGETVELVYDVTFVESGVVLLNNTLDGLIESVECEGDGDTAQATVTLSRPFDPSRFAEMFPVGSVLAVDSDLFGGCDFGGLNAVLEEPLEDYVLETLDGYLNIDTVQPVSDQVVTLSGTPSSYFFLFQEGSISVRPHDDGSRRRVQAQATCDPRTGPPEEEPTDPTSWRIFKNVGLSLGADVDCDADADMDYVLEGPYFDADFGIFSGLELSVDFTYGLAVCARFGCVFSASQQNNIFLLKNTTSLRVPYFAVKLPVFGKVGLFLEPKIRFERIGRFEGSIGGDIVLSGDIGTYNMRFELTGDWDGLSATFTETELQASNWDGDWVPVVESEGQTELFFGFQPSFAFYLGSNVKADVSAKAGVNLLQTDLGGSNVFPPVDDSSLLPFLVGACDQCHQQEHDYGFKSKDLKFEFAITKKFGPFGVGDVGFIWKYLILAEIFNLVVIKYCDEDRVAESGLCAEPTSSPTRVLTPSPTPNNNNNNGDDIGPPTDRGNGNDSSFSGDPHISTFSRIRFDCQGAGEFGMVESPGALFALQGRFTRFSSAQITVTTGVLIRDEGSKTIQFSEALNDPATRTLGGCPVHLFLDGALVSGPVGDVLDDSFDPGLSGVRILVGSSSFRVTYDTGVDLVVSVSQSNSFGCWFHSSIYIPFTFRPDETLIGVLGSANDNAVDGWLARDGTSLPFSPGISSGYNYCVDNWQLSEAESLFAYETGKSYSDFADPGPYIDSVNLDNAEPAVKDFCNGDEDCLLEGLLGGIEAARELQQIDAGLRVFRGGGDFLTSSSAFALAGATVLNFGAIPLGTYTQPMQLQGVTFDPGASFFRISTGQPFNTDGPYLDNHFSGFERLEIRFSVKVTAFGFNWGASNEVWTLTGYDSEGSLVASFDLPILASSNNGEFFGISGTPMASAVVQTTLQASDDWVLIDNFSFVMAPTPTPITSSPTLNQEPVTAAPSFAPTTSSPTLNQGPVTAAPSFAPTTSSPNLNQGPVPTTTPSQ